MNKFKSFFKGFIYTTLLLLFICSSIYIIKYGYDTYTTKKQSDLLNDIKLDTDHNIIDENNNSSNDISQNITPEKSERMLKVEELQKTNSDIVGWIEIENTNINYPVLQGTDNDFYMNHNYKKNYSSSGAIFLDKNYSWNPPSSNLLIYGHNMKNGTMFRDLLKYKNKDFFNKHPNIRFTTNEEDSTFEIIAVFRSKVYYESDKNVFKYYYFINAENEDEFNSFINNAKKASLYDTMKTAKYGEQLITLSTCAYHTKDGRFVVVAKKSG